MKKNKKKEPEILKDSIRGRYYMDYLAINGEAIDLIDCAKYYTKTFMIRVMTKSIRKVYHWHYVELMKNAERYTPQLYQYYREIGLKYKTEGIWINCTEEELLKLDPEVTEPITRIRKKPGRKTKE